jgi:hypothetical protein
LVPHHLSPPEQYSIFIVPPSSIQVLTLIKKIGENSLHVSENKKGIGCKVIGNTRIFIHIRGSHGLFIYDFATDFFQNSKFFNSVAVFLK